MKKAFITGITGSLKEERAMRWGVARRSPMLLYFPGLAGLCFALFIVSSCGRRVEAPQFYRFDDNLDKAGRIRVPEVQKTDTGLSFEFDGREAPVWKAGKSTSVCEIKDGLLVFETEDVDSVVSPENLQIRARDVESILIRMKSRDTDLAHLYWRRQQGQFNDEGRFTVNIPETDRWYTFEIKALGLLRWEGVIEQLKLKVPGKARVEVDSIRVLTKEAHFSENPVGVLQYKIGSGINPGNSYRSCLYAHCPAEIEYRVGVPENAYISTGLGIIRSTSPVTFSVLVKRKGFFAASTQLFSREVEKAGEWHDTKIDMSGYAGEEVDILFKVDCEEPTNIALWSNPILYHAKSASEVSSLRSRAPRGQDVNVVLYLIDALRADHLDVYGYQRETAPTIRGLAKEGVRFARCFAHDTWTKSSVSSLFTGTTAWVHGVADDGDIVPDSFITVAEILRSRGYATGAVTSNGYPGPVTNLAQGLCQFERPDSLEAVVESARWFLEMHKDRNFFLYVHTLEPHAPYAPPDQFANKFVMPGQNPAEIDLYDGEVLYADANLKRFISALKDAGVYDDTLLLVTSDHGEAFREHEGMTEHGGKPYNELIHIPLIMHLPGFQPKVNVVEQNVGLIDVGPTILDVLGVSPPDQFQGASLLPLVGGEVFGVFDDRRIYSRARGGDSMSVIDGNWKLLFSDSGKPKLFNLAVDFGETKNLADTNEPLVTRLLDEAKVYAASQEKIGKAIRGGAEEGSVKLDQRTIEQLKRLGYIK